jgi:hypothetical protein
VSVQAAPGAVFVRMRRQFGGQPAMRHMFAEMTAGEALALARELEAAVRVAAVTAFPP